MAVLGLAVVLGVSGWLAGSGSVTAVRVVTAGVAVVAALAVTGCAVRIRRDGHEPALAWTPLLLALITEVAARTLGLAHPSWFTGFPAWLDLGHVAALVLLGVGMARLPGSAAAGSGWRLAGDGVGVGFATVMLAGRPVLDNLDTAGGAAYVASAHVLAGVVVATAALVVLSRLRHPGGPSLPCMLLLSTAALCAVAADSGATAARLSGTYAVGSLPDFGWLASAALIGAAAWWGPTQDHAEVTDWRERIAVLGLVLPSVAVLAVAGALVLAGQRLSKTSVVALFGLAATVLFRHAIARIDHLVIARTLEEKVAERTLGLVTREQWFRSLVQHSSDVLTVVDEGGVVRYQSPAVTRVFGHDPAPLVGTPITYLVRPSDVRRLQDVLAAAARAPRSTFMVEFAMWHRDGRWCETETTITSLLDDDDIRGLVLNTRDISERKQLEAALTHQAFHDNLTGLANRVLFLDRVAQALSRADQAQRVAVLFLDLDGFKGVNDTQGHAVGDQLLGLVAERLTHCVRAGDTVARLGGDEFAVLVCDADANRAAIWVAERVRAALGQPFVMDGRELSIGVSIGIALNLTPFESADALLRNADVAMYKAKATREGGWVRFEPGMRDALLERMELENDLKHALARDQLAVYFQPTVELATGHVVGAEALLRWHHPSRGQVGPDGFIGLAEETGLITPIGEWVLRETCRLGARWQSWAPSGGHFHVAVNISARQLAPGLVPSVRQALAESGLPPAALVLEITESLLVERTDDVLAMLHQLKALGVRLAIDDFGTGYSSLSYLSRFPVDVLKMDKSFVEVVANMGEQSELAKAIIHLGQSLHLSTVAEGIETKAQYAALRAMGCDFGQGYLFARALPAHGLDELLSCRLTDGTAIAGAPATGRAATALAS